ncbi:flagellar P-ring protein [Candidatus Photodesmus katoptron]|uniref:flagellar basal body P-ring protein FlgI n=1 Tax=Candidatus Photodesmus anomalopis TaxID=28176 RepID=UPI0004D978C3|nr:flagellar basal body P-ring protein FlgI [Candidatus Photodesmus katoptron]KEY90253.1 flagellar P-ring protein [Candidatus Photodesmus katoptron]
MKSFFLLISVSLLIVTAETQSARIKDIAQVSGIRSNQLLGYGLVTGLSGTGESTPFTERSFNAMLRNFGISLPDGKKLKNKNVASVIVTASMPAFAKQGQTLDVTVSSIGSAKSLRGGTLIQTFLKGLDGEVYAIAQGNLIVSAFSSIDSNGSKILGNNLTSGMIPNGAMIEREVHNPFSRGDFITLNLLESDFTTSQRMAYTINSFLGSEAASSIDATSVKVRAPRDINQRVSFLSTIENLDFEPADVSAKIVVNSHTGTIVIGKHVRIKPAAITHGNMTVAIKETETFDEQGSNSSINKGIPETKGKMFKFAPGLTLEDLVRTINEVGAAPSDLIVILQALKRAGAIEGKIIIL